MSRASRPLLICGIAAPLVYLFTDVVASLSYDGYSWADQVVSELFAVEAPTRDFVVALFTVYNCLLLAFAVGVWRSADDRRALRAIAVLMAASAVLGVVTDFFAPMHSRGIEQGASGQWHAILTGVQVAFIIAMVACGTRTLAPWFRRASVAEIVLLLIVGSLVPVFSADPATTEATPGFGIVERVLIYTYLAWTAMLAVGLLGQRQAE